MKLIVWILGIILGISNCIASQNIVCRQPYALCTTAPCKAVPGVKNQSLCSCVVKDGPSLGQLSCNERKPVINAQGQQQLRSNFSFENAATNKVMICKGNHYWTDCLDKPCIIDPVNSNQAMCTCEIKYSNDFLTFGGQCQTASCDTTLYSGASRLMLSEGTKALVNALQLTKSPMQNCPELRN